MPIPAPAITASRATHPCLACGACCAAFRVAFHWSECAPNGVVPEDAVVRWDAHRVALRGTDSRMPRCAQLDGSVGQGTFCRIYARRPTPCRDMRAAWEDGAPSDQCDRARAAYGLAPLSASDWRRP